MKGYCNDEMGSFWVFAAILLPIDLVDQEGKYYSPSV
jgi:hypothetical protein